MKLAADANVLLASLIGGKAKQILRHPEVTDILTTAGVVGEIAEYVPILARKKRLSLDILLAAAASKSFRLQAVPPMWESRFGPSKAKRAIVAFIGGVVAMFGARLADG